MKEVIEQKEETGGASFFCSIVFALRKSITTIDQNKFKSIKYTQERKSYMSFYDFSAKKINGQEMKMEDYKGKVVLVVNTASKCGLTPQFKDLELLYQGFQEKGFEILGFPCNQFANQDSGSNEEMNQTY